MAADEQVLGAGGPTHVVKIGETVRRPARPFTATIHTYLRHLGEAGISFVPEPLGYDEQGRDLIVTAPDPVRASLRDLPLPALIRTCAALRPDLGDIGDPRQAVKVSLRALARRHLALTDEITDLDALIDPLVTAINPDLPDLFGVGPDTAGQLLVTAGQNSDRVHSEAAFAMLCGTAPLPASSGRTHRHRLNRGGDRQANAVMSGVAGSNSPPPRADARRVDSSRSSMA